MQTGKLKAICISENKGTEKHAVGAALINKKGIVGDAHAGDWHRQISLLSFDIVEKFRSENPQVKIIDGAFGENLLIEGIELCKPAVGDRIKIGEVELEITQIGKECHGDGCTIFRSVGKCIMPKTGLFSKVIRTGSIQPGDEVIYMPAGE
ncbi:MAG: MOSC domain-containing protein [Candidatus Delongbacteria bacterium]|nr:MOSC domain-containing protein [Candidatus Delongbacteria bacterium]